jgi:methylphosphotriester-DNA--protein-cysteine methyltransferase
MLSSHINKDAKFEGIFITAVKTTDILAVQFALLESPKEKT